MASLAVHGSLVHKPVQAIRGLSTRLVSWMLSLKLVAHEESEIWTHPSHNFTKEGLLQYSG